MSLAGPETHFGGAFQFVPSEALAFDGALHGLEQYHREQLAVREALQPYLAEQPGIFAGFGLAAFEGKRDGGSDEIDDQKSSEEQYESLDIGRVSRVRMKMFLNEILDRTNGEHEIDEW